MLDLVKNDVMRELSPEGEVPPSDAAAALIARELEESFGFTFEYPDDVYRIVLTLQNMGFPLVSGHIAEALWIALSRLSGEARLWKELPKDDDTLVFWLQEFLTCQPQRWGVWVSTYENTACVTIIDHIEKTHMTGEALENMLGEGAVQILSFRAYTVTEAFRYYDVLMNSGVVGQFLGSV